MSSNIIKLGQFGYLVDRQDKMFNFQRKSKYDLLIQPTSPVNCNMSFSNVQYPECCGISILHGFWAGNPASTDKEQLSEFFKATYNEWCPTIQFVAIKRGHRDEEYDFETGELIKNTLEINNNYVFSNFVNNLIELTDAKIIHSFINSNSDNQCDVYQFNRKALL